MEQSNAIDTRMTLHESYVASDHWQPYCVQLYADNNENIKTLLY